MNIGKNARLTRTQLDHAVLERVRTLAVAEGKGAELPADPLDFAARAKVVFVDANGQPLAEVPFTGVVVTWE